MHTYKTPHINTRKQDIWRILEKYFNVGKYNNVLLIQYKYMTSVNDLATGTVVKRSLQFVSLEPRLAPLYVHVLHGNRCGDTANSILRRAIYMHI